MKTLLLSLLLAAPLCAWADAPRVLFRTEFAANGSVSDVVGSIVARDADGFSTLTPMRASTLPKAQQAQFGALQGALIAAANAGGWRLTGGELSETGSTADFTVQANPKAGQEGEPDTVSVETPGTRRAVLTLWMTQSRGGRTRYQTMSSEAWPPEVRKAVLALWEWVKQQK